MKTSFFQIDRQLHPGDFLFLMAADSFDIRFVTVGDKRPENPDGSGDHEIGLGQRRDQRRAGDADDGGQRYHLPDLQGDHEDHKRNHKHLDRFMGDEQAGGQQIAKLCRNRLAALEIGEDREAMPRAAAHAGVDRSLRNKQDAQANNEEGFQTIQHNHGDAGLFSQHAAGVGAAQIAGAKITNVGFIEDFADD